MDDEMRAKVSALLEAVVMADGVLRPEEREFVRRAANRWKLPAACLMTSLSVTSLVHHPRM